MSYHLGSVDPPAPRDPGLRRGRLRGDPEDERGGEVGDPPGGRLRLLARGILSAALVLLVMAAFAGGVWFAHVAGQRHPGGGTQDVPLLRADPHSFKVRPATPGGMVVPDQNMLVYGERHDTVEHLLPPPEAPLPRPAPPPPPAPKRAAVPPPPAAPTVAPATAPTPAAPPAKNLTTAPASATSAATPAPAAAPTPPARPAIANSAAVKTGSGGIRLQLGAVRTPEAARREWQHLKEANTDLLGGVAGFAVRADLGAKGVYYRIETAPFADPAAAARICGALKRRGAGCILDR